MGGLFLSPKRQYWSTYDSKKCIMKHFSYGKIISLHNVFTVMVFFFLKIFLKSCLVQATKAFKKNIFFGGGNFTP